MDIISFGFPFPSYKRASQSRYRILPFFKVTTNAAITTGINRRSIITLQRIYRSDVSYEMWTIKPEAVIQLRRIPSNLSPLGQFPMFVDEKRNMCRGEEEGHRC